MKERKFEFKVARGGGPRSYTKKESELTANETQLLVASFIADFNKLPETGKMLFIHYLNQAIQDGYKEKIQNDLSKGETGDNNPTESDTPISNENQTTEGVHSDSGISSEGEKSEI